MKPEGTKVYCAPESFEAGLAEAAWDVWSAGCCALEMLRGNLWWAQEKPGRNVELEIKRFLLY